MWPDTIEATSPRFLISGGRRGGARSALPIARDALDLDQSHLLVRVVAVTRRSRPTCSTLAVTAASALIGMNQATGLCIPQVVHVLYLAVTKRSKSQFPVSTLIRTINAPASRPNREEMDHPGDDVKNKKIAELSVLKKRQLGEEVGTVRRLVWVGESYRDLAHVL